MTRDKLMNQYHAEASILQACLSSGGGSYTAPTYGKAVLFRQRCYAFMKKYREADLSASQFDVLTLKALPPKRLVNPDLPIAVRIEVRKMDGEFVPDQPLGEEYGEERNPAPEPETNDPFMAEALETRKRLGL